jgi:SAM-dependent methyltransferase
MLPLKEAQKIQGWMTPSELLWLRNTALAMRPGARIVEIGSWKGRSTVALAVDHVDLTCVDTFRGANSDWNTSILARVQDVFQIFKQNMNKLRERPRVLFMPSEQAALYFPDNSVDWVFEDSDHGPKFRKHFWIWYRKVKPGGLYSGHDYDKVSFPVIPKVLHSSGLQFSVIPNTTIWALKKPL